VARNALQVREMEQITYRVSLQKLGAEQEKPESTRSGPGGKCGSSSDVHWWWSQESESPQSMWPTSCLLELCPDHVHDSHLLQVHKRVSYGKSTEVKVLGVSQAQQQS
ncbi:mCG145851, partial [Mus musculus]